MKALWVWGNKYSFRSMGIPVLRQMNGWGQMDLVLLDFPQGDEIRPLLEELQSAGRIRSWALIPDNRRAVAHHRALSRISRKSKKEGFDLLLLDDDSVPMAQYFIRAARRVRASVIALQTVAPVKLLRAHAAKEVQQTKSSPLFSQRIQLSRISSQAQSAWRFLGNRLRGEWRVFLHYRLLPGLLTGRRFDRNELERKGLLQFASPRVDGAIVYSDSIREAFRHFFPELQVWVARHPLAGQCRCGGSELSQRSLLVTLGGPWVNSVSRSNPSETIQSRWVEAIRSAVSMGGFEEVSIRPHPRETEEHPDQLADRLNRLGIRTRVVSPSMGTLPELICGYAGLIGAPSGALLEALVSCQRAFVIGLEGVERDSAIKPVQYYSEDLVIKRWEEPFRKEDFQRKTTEGTSRSSVAEILASYA